jgi:hypothetical protein
MTRKANRLVQDAVEVPKAIKIKVHVLVTELSVHGYNLSLHVRASQVTMNPKKLQLNKRLLKTVIVFQDSIHNAHQGYT